MGLKLLAAAAAIGLSLAGCVAPEEPEAPHASRAAPAPSPTAATGANFQDAPVPNRQLRPGVNDSVIRFAH